MEEEHSNGRRAFQWKKSIPMEEEHSNGRRAFQWKKSVPMEEEHSIEEFRCRKLEKAAAESAATS